MIAVESFSEFYKRINRSTGASPTALQKGGEYFDVCSGSCNNGQLVFSYRDFYKISLLSHTGKLFYAGKWIEVNHRADLENQSRYDFISSTYAPLM